MNKWYNETTYRTITSMFEIQIAKKLKLIGLLLLAIMTSACQKPGSRDQLECLNRGIYGFNKNADRVVLKPVARVYEAVIPDPLRRMVSNFFQNLSEIPTVANDLLQGDFAHARADTARFLLNSTWGMGGLFDIAKARTGLEHHPQDFGLTLAKWGYKNSQYLVLPFFGPSTVRDGIGRAGTLYMSVPWHLKSVRLRNALWIAQFIDARANLLKVEPALDEAIDEYIFVRNAYFQYRDQLIKGERTPEETQEMLDEGPPE